MKYESPREKPGSRPAHIEVAGRAFSFVRSQRGDKTAIYTSGDAYMRIGESGAVGKDLALHKRMENAGFPVARLLEEGEKDGLAYFIEESLGEQHLGGLFAEDTERIGSISEERFAEFLNLAKQYARAQLTTASNNGTKGEFSRGIWLERLQSEMPEHAEALGRRFSQAWQHIEALPRVLTHGDFNPHNLYPKGIIDLEYSSQAPYGYDIVSAITHITYFPDPGEYEYYAKYRFTDEQKQAYLAAMDAVSDSAGVPPVSKYAEDFEFCRAVWLAANLAHTPRLQQFRFEMLINKFLR